MKIDLNHKIDVAIQRPFPGGSAMENRRYLIWHYTEGWGAEGTFAWWKNPAARGVTAHFVIDRDGKLYQCRPTNITCGHAGESVWKDRRTGITYRNLNSCSIGIEFCNIGNLKGRNVYPSGCGALTGQQIRRIQLKHPLHSKPDLWEEYTEPQLATGLALSAVLKTRYNLDDGMSHWQISPDRKLDAGPAFPLDAFRHQLGWNF